jgi:succinoglycan biosynthesis transport protein ExoP
MTTGGKTVASGGTLSWQEYWQMARRRRWLLLLPVALCWSAVWVVCWFLPAIYRSETLILVEQQKVSEHYVVPNMAVGLQGRLQSMTQQILSRTRLRRIIDELNLYPAEKPRLGPDELVERMRKDIKIEIVETPGRPDELTAFKILYSGPDPKVSQAVTEHLATFFIDENIRSREKLSEETTSFLDNQLQDARTHLEEQEKRVREFKAQYLGELPGQLQSNLQILSGLQGRLQDANERLERAEQQKVYLKSLLSEYQALSQQIRDGEKGEVAAPASLDDELDKLKRQLAALQAQYTDNYPDVVKVRQQIAKTEQLRRQITTDLTGAQDTKDSGDSDLVSGNQKTMSPVLDIRSQIKRKKEIEQLGKNVDEYKVRLNQTPIREQELADLTRDYDQSRANYESLLAKSNQSELATNLEKQQQGEQFRVIDPPSLPRKAYWPDRLQLSFFGLVVGALVGVVSTFIVESVDDRVHHEADLVSVAALPVLGIVPSMLTVAEHRRQHWRIGFEVAGSFVITVVLVAGTVFAYYRG